MANKLRNFTVWTFLWMFTSFVWAKPRVGFPPPPLRVSKVLQAPSGAQTDWASLRGKTVILEFWATWCPHCLENIPHLNRLAASLDPEKFVFIAVDDEDPKIIETYTGRRRMAGWIAEDANGATVRAYGVASRPTTVVVGPTGKIAAITVPDQLTIERLQAIADRSFSINAPEGGVFDKLKITHTTNSHPTPKNTALAEQALPLFRVAIRSVSSTNQIYRTHSADKTSWRYEGMSADLLWSLFYPEPQRRFTFTKPLPTGQYEVLADYPGVSSNTMQEVLRTALCGALRVQVTRTITPYTAFVLRSTDEANSKLLAPISDDDPQNVFIKDGELTVMASTFAQIAPVLEEYLGVPVLDETGITRIIDASVTLPLKEPASVAKALRAALGIELVPMQREIPMYTVTPVETEKVVLPSNEKIIAEPKR